jgi:hypothetical protein
MKKIIAITIIAFITTSLIFVSCKKNQIDPVGITNTTKQTRAIEDNITYNNVVYNISDGILKFSSLTEYENLFGENTQPDTEPFSNLILNSPAIKTYYSTIPNSNTAKSNLKFIGSIINSDKVVKIGEFLILLDFESDKVYAKTDGTLAELNNAKNGQSVAGVLKYDMGDDVIQELKLKKTRGLFCNANWCGKGRLGDNSLLISFNSGGNNFNHPHVVSGNYQKYGIWFNYWAETFVDGFPNSFSAIAGSRSMSASGSFTRRCGNTVNNTASHGNSFTAYIDKLMYGNVRSLSRIDATMIMVTTTGFPIPNAQSSYHDIR